MMQITYFFTNSFTNSWSQNSRKGKTWLGFFRAVSRMARGVREGALPLPILEIALILQVPL